MSRFRSITVVGVGLIGGSLAAAARSLERPPFVRGIDTDAEALGWAVANGVLDEGKTPDEAREAGWLAAGSTDAVFIATPASVTEEWLRELGESGYDGLVSDVASTKTAVLKAARESLKKACFVGGHPMAGSERSGVGAARADLFDGAYYVLTPDQDTDMDAFRRLHSFVQSLGARVVVVDPASHDEAVAVISHVPHVAASALTNLASARSGGGEGVLRLAAGGFKDMTRIAAGSPDLWTGICLDNADALLRGLEEYSQVLEDFSAALYERDAAALREWLGRAAQVRRSLPAQWVPATSALRELTVPVTDRPGAVSDVTLSVSRRGCNIEDIEIDHQSEDTAVLRLVLTDEGDLESVVSELQEMGYSPSVRPL